MGGVIGIIQINGPRRLAHANVRHTHILIDLREIRPPDRLILIQQEL